jgi:hypothetical protein
LVEEIAVIIASVLAGIGGGFLSSWMSFNASGEKWDPRKHGNALITGALAGIGLGIAAASSAPKNMDAAQALVLFFTIFLSAVGIDRLRTTGSRMIVRNVQTGKLEVANKEERQTKDIAEKKDTTTTSTTSPPPPK